eukprot:scaffold880_cov132-Cylindrotheca_fusiformis.AAC.52
MSVSCWRSFDSPTRDVTEPMEKQLRTLYVREAKNPRQRLIMSFCHQARRDDTAPSDAPCFVKV